FYVDVEAEITLEANPDDITNEKLLTWKEYGINRLSIGVQSFFDEDLQWMNRAHNAIQAYKSISLAMQSGFDNISVDFIYGTPSLTDERWLQNLETALQLNIPHLSCYALTVEPNTALQKMIELHKKEELSLTQKINEYIMTALRTHEGIELQHLGNLAGEKTVAGILKDAGKFIQQNLIEKKNGSLVLTPKGKLFADGIAADLFRV